MLLGTGCIIYIANACVNFASINSVFLFLSQMQIIMILPKIGAYMSKQVTLFIADMYHWLWNLDFMISDKKKFFGIETNLNYEQSDSYLELLQIKSGSAILNTQGNIILILNLLIVYLIANLVHFLIKFWNAKWIEYTNIVKNLAAIILKLFCFLIYINLMFISVPEVYKHDLNSKEHIISTYLSMLVLVIACVIKLSTIIIWMASKTYNRVTNHGHLNHYIKCNRFCWFYYCAFILKRGIYCTVVMLGWDISFITILRIFLWTEVCYTWYMTFFRPFKSTTSNISEITCSLFYIVYVSLLFHYNKEQDWNLSISKTYIILIIWNNAILNLIGLCSLCVYAVHHMYMKRKK